jgi:hypothetical protein
MSFEALIDKVKQAETALEAHERQAAADAHQLLATWRAAWTPGRILLAGVGSGFAIGLLEPGKRFAGGRNALQMLTTVAGLFAGGSAQAAADKAEDAADAAQAQGGPTLSPDDIALRAAVAPPTDGASVDGTDPDALRRAGLL